MGNKKIETLKYLYLFFICFLMSSMETTLRAPICGIFGHVDSGKTSFLSKLKSFETIEAGGITQGTTSVFIPIDKIKSMCKKIIDLKELYGRKKTSEEFEIKIPGILFIDTPGHEAFGNFRRKTACICDMALVIIDIEKGVEPQAVESIQMLTENKIPFIVCLTKLDKVTGWNIVQTPNLRQSIKNQSPETMIIVNTMLADIKYELSKSQIDAEFYFNNKTPKKTVSIIPVSNLTGEGFNDLINYLIFMTQNFIPDRLIPSDEIKGFVMSKSFDKTLGWTAQIILASGTLRNTNQIVITTCDGPVKSVIRNMIGVELNPDTNRFTRSYFSTQTASASITLFAPHLENIVTGSYLYVPDTRDDIDTICEKISNSEIRESFITRIRHENSEKLGYYMFTSSEDEFEAGYNAFSSNQIQIHDGAYGPLTTKAIDFFEIVSDKMIKTHGLDRTLSTRDKNGKIFQEKLLEYKIILYYTSLENKPHNFDDLVEYAKQKEITILHNDVVYRLIDDFRTLQSTIIQSRQELYLNQSFVITPCELKLLKQHVYLKGGSQAFVIGFKVVEGTVNVGTIILAKCKNGKILNLGSVASIEKTKEKVSSATKNSEVCIKITNPEHYLWQKDFTDEDTFISGMTREGVEILKRDFRSRLGKNEWILAVKIVKLLGI